MSQPSATGDTFLRLACALIAILVPAIWIGMQLDRPDEALRIRTAMVAEVGRAEDFSWTPESTPATYQRNLGAVPDLYAQAARSATAELPEPRGALATGEAFAHLLMRAPQRREDPIRADSTVSYHGVVEEGRGYCADFVNVFNGLSIAAGVPVRDWGFSFDAFGSGHAFNEVYDGTLKKWVMVDSYHSLIFVDQETRVPLSVLEVHDRLLDLGATNRPLAVERLVPARFAFKSDELAIDYYRRGMPQLFMVWGNNLFDYEHAWPVRTASRVSRAAGQLVGIVLGYYPRIRIYPVGLSDRDLGELRSRGTEFLVAVGVQFVALVLGGLEIIAVARRRRRLV